MKREVAYLFFGFVVFGACQSVAKKSESASAPISPFEKRIIADFALRGVQSKYASGFIEPMDVNTALKDRYPKMTTRELIERLVKAKEWPRDVLVLRTQDSLAVYYYEVENRKDPRIGRYWVRFRFSAANNLDRVDYYTDHFSGGVPPEMPKSLLETSN